MSYILAIASVIFISAAVMGILPESSIKKTVKTVCGAVMACIVISPFVGFDNIDFPQNFDEIEITENTQMILFSAEKEIERKIAEKYGGDVRVNIEDGIFTIWGADADKSELEQFLGIEGTVIQIGEE